MESRKIYQEENTAYHVVHLGSTTHAIRETGPACAPYRVLLSVLPVNEVFAKKVAIKNAIPVARNSGEHKTRKEPLPYWAVNAPYVDIQNSTKRWIFTMRINQKNDSVCHTTGIVNGLICKPKLINVFFYVAGATQKYTPSKSEFESQKAHHLQALA